jgi:uncharacterized protein (DUF2267 family)
MSVNLNKYVEEANRFFKDVAVELGNPSDINHASRVTIAILHTLRERISPEESMHLIAQLPMILKGIYVDGWKITRQQNDVTTVDEFLDEVRAHCIRSAERDLGNNQEARAVVYAVLRVMRQYIDEGEMKHIKHQLPQTIAELFE